MKKGVLYYVWGNYNKSLLDRSIKSLKFHNNYDYHIATDDSDYKNFQKRANLFNSSPFDITLYLDIDTIIKGKLDYGFDMAEKYKIACCIAPASSSYYAAFGSIKNKIPVELPQYNCGVLFFSQKAKQTFNIYSELLKKHSASAQNDQPYFSYAIYQTLNPYILPKTWNFRHHLNYESSTWHGNLKIIHSEHDI